MTNSIQFIDGCWEAGEGQLFKSIDPARNEVIWSGEAASETQVEKAILAARAAFPDWSGRSVEERLAICQNSLNCWKKIKSTWLVPWLKKPANPFGKLAPKLAL